MRRGKTIGGFLRFLRASKGATAIEYALIAAGISIAVIGGVTTLGTGIKAVFYDKLSAMF